MKKPLTERFQKLAGIKPLYEQPVPDEEVSDEELPDGEETGEEGTEEEMSKDAERLKKIIEDIINTKDEWYDMFEILLDQAIEIPGMNESLIRTLLQNKIKEL